MNTASPAGIPDTSADYTLLAAAGSTGPIGPTGATGAGLTGLTDFDPTAAPFYTAGQVVLYEGASYVVNINNPSGIPGTSPDYTLLAAAGPTEPTGVTGAGLQGIVPFDPLAAAAYTAGQPVTFNGSSYVANVNSPAGTPGASADYTLLAAVGSTGATGDTGLSRIYRCYWRYRIDRNHRRYWRYRTDRIYRCYWRYRIDRIYRRYWRHRTDRIYRCYWRYRIEPDLPALLALPDRPDLPVLLALPD